MRGRRARKACHKDTLKTRTNVQISSRYRIYFASTAKNGGYVVFACLARIEFVPPNIQIDTNSYGRT